MTIKINIKSIFLILLVCLIFISSLYTLLFKRNDIHEDNWDDFDKKIKQEVKMLTRIEMAKIEDNSDEEKVSIKYFLIDSISDGDIYYLIKNSKEMLYKMKGTREIYIWFEIYVNNKLIEIYEPSSYTYWSAISY